MLLLRCGAVILIGTSLGEGRCGNDASSGSGFDGILCAGSDLSGRGVGPIDESVDESDDEDSGLDGRL